MAVEPACVADVVSDGVRGRWGPDACEPNVLPAVEPVLRSNKSQCGIARTPSGGEVGETGPSNTS